MRRTETQYQELVLGNYVLVAYLALSGSSPPQSTWCIEIKTMDIPKTKFIVKIWPNNAADAMPVKIVATVEEYFFRIVSARKKAEI